VFAESYADVFIALRGVQSEGYKYLATDGRGWDEEAAPAEAPAANENGTAGTGVTDYSETNTQVTGIDEGDIVKTDGTSLRAAQS
jgi:uncharacterized secreted protein with C-terminal beta-propeller domain